MPRPPAPPVTEPLALAVVVIWEEHPLDTRVTVSLTEGRGAALAAAPADTEDE